MKVAKQICQEKTKIEQISRFSSSHPSSALAHPLTVTNALRTANMEIEESFKNMQGMITDFESTLLVLKGLIDSVGKTNDMRDFLVSLSESFEEEIELRKSIKMAISAVNSTNIDDLHALMVLASELGDFALSRSIGDCHSLRIPPEMESARAFLRAQMTL